MRPDPAPSGLGELGAAFLVRRQLAGIRRAVAAGLTVKVNTVLIPGVNFEGAGPDSLETGASESGALETGAPRPGWSEISLVARAMASRPPPSCDELRRAGREAASFLPQFRLCRQCRADAVGVPGLEVGPADGHGFRH